MRAQGQEALRQAGFERLEGEPHQIVCQGGQAGGCGGAVLEAGELSQQGVQQRACFGKARQPGIRQTAQRLGGAGGGLAFRQAALEDFDRDGGVGGAVARHAEKALRQQPQRAKRSQPGVAEAEGGKQIQRVGGQAGLQTFGDGHVQVGAASLIELLQVSRRSAAERVLQVAPGDLQPERQVAVALRQRVQVGIGQVCQTRGEAAQQVQAFGARQHVHAVVDQRKPGGPALLA